MKIKVNLVRYEGCCTLSSVCGMDKGNGSCDESDVNIGEMKRAIGWEGY